MTTLARIRLNPASRECRSDMRNVQLMHWRIMSMFPHAAARRNRRTVGILWRDETAEKPGLLVQSPVVPDFSVLPDRYAVCEHTNIDRRLFHFRNGQIVQYRVIVNPARHSRGDGDLRFVAVPVAEQVEWWLTKTAQTGLADVCTPVPSSVPAKPLRRAGDGRLVYVYSTRFDGLAEVVDADRLRAAVKGGVGGATAWGCGLLTVAALV